MTEREFWPLSTTKLRRPRVSAPLVPRPRLLEHLSRAWSCPLTLVCASAGYGKTTLVSAWCEQLAADREATAAPLPLAWLSLDQHDSDLTVFVRYLCAAIETRFPAACSHTLALLHAPRQAPLDVLITTLSNELNRLPSDCLVVLDDFHLVSGVAVHDLLAGLLRHWPWSLHLVVLTRGDPGLPLSTLRAKGYLSELRTHELRFVATEVAQYLTRVRGQPPSAETVAQLE